MLTIMGKRLRAPSAQAWAKAVSIALLALALCIVATACVNLLQRPSDPAEPPSELS